MSSPHSHYRATHRWLDYPNFFPWDSHLVPMVQLLETQSAEWMRRAGGSEVTTGRLTALTTLGEAASEESLQPEEP